MGEFSNALLGAPIYGRTQLLLICTAGLNIVLSVQNYIRMAQINVACTWLSALADVTTMDTLTSCWSLTSL